MKLTVFAAFGASISYIAAHFIVLVRIVWLPALLMMAATAYLTPAMLEAQMGVAVLEDEAQRELAALALMGESFKTAGYIYLAAAIFYPMMIAGLLRYIMRGEKPGFLPFYLWYGADEFRVLISYIVMAVMFMVAGFAGFLGVLVVGIVLSFAAQEAGVIVAAVLGLAAVIAFIWFCLRMSLIFPATVADRTIGLGRSWQVTKGAVWGLFFYWILWGVVLAFLCGIYAFFGAASMFEMLPDIFAAGGDEAAMAEIEQRMLEAQMNLYDPSQPGFWTYNVATYAYLVISTVFSCAAGGVAYRFLAGEERA